MTKDAVLKEYMQILDDFSHFLASDSLFYSHLGPETATAAAPTTILNKCQACARHLGVNPYVAGVGSRQPDLLVLGDSPATEPESLQRVFNRQAGELFTRMLSAMKLKREQVFITTLFKCAGSENDTWGCKAFLEQQVAELKPKVILALGERAIKELLGSDNTLVELRGKWFKYHGIPVLATYHPDELLSRVELKKTVWEDLQLVMGRLSE